MKNTKICASENIEIPKNTQKGILYELILEIVDPVTYHAYIRNRIHQDADQQAAVAKARMTSKIVLNTLVKRLVRNGRRK